MPGQFSGTRGSAQGWIAAMIGEGATNAQIADFLQLNNLSYRTQNMYADINRIRLEQFAGQKIKNFDMDTPIPERLMGEWQGNTDYRYRVVVQYEYTPRGGGDVLKGGTTLYYDQAPTVNEVLENWDVRRQTLEGGFGSDTTVDTIQTITEINYFVNRPKE
jgi:hypothetical protein